MKRWEVIPPTLVVLGIALTVAYEAKKPDLDIPRRPLIADPFRVIGLSRDHGLMAVCDLERGHLIYEHYNHGLAVIPGGCRDGAR